MSKTMTPSNMTTDGQIDKAVANYRALLQKHASEFDSGAVQTVLGRSELAKEQFSVFRRHVEMIGGNMITRKTTVNRSQTPKEALVATGCNQYVNDKVAKTMTTGEGEEVTVTFFKPTEEEYTRPGWISDDDLEKCYQRRGLKPDPRAQAKVNEDDPSFADDHPNGTHWKDSSGKWCFVTFDRWRDVRRVRVRRDRGWCDRWWFAGVPASN